MMKPAVFRTGSSHVTDSRFPPNCEVSFLFADGWPTRGPSAQWQSSSASTHLVQPSGQVLSHAISSCLLVRVSPDRVI